MISTKLGLHIIGGTALAVGRPRVVKLVDTSVAYVRQVRTLVGPECLIVVRWVENNLLDSPADSWFHRHLAQMQAMADPMVAFESANEVADSDAARYSLWELSRMRLMHTMGLRSVVGNWSVGTPDLPVWAMYGPLLAEMRPGVDGDLVGLHEYWADYADISNRWHCGRWAIVPALGGKAIVITECGRDVVEGRGKPGWQLSCTPAEYLADLRAYARLMAYSNVAGGVVFQVGAIGNTWKAFNAAPVWPTVVSEYEGAPMPIPTIVLICPIRPMPVITQAFGVNPQKYPSFPGHPGLDYRAAEGTVIRAPCTGEVHIGNPNGAYAAYGVHLWIRGDDQGRVFWVILGHLSRVLADDHERVDVGDIIALSGNTGHSTGAHLHLGIETTKVNPGYQDSHDQGFYWQNPESFMQPLPG
jgi:hypothetical protein